jgi:two-component system, chemotaxis family, protein-glutamate methylesterase/glutaminase
VKQSIRALIVDDSAFARFAISKRLQADPDIEVVDFARNGLEAVEKTQRLKPDVLTLDVEMPRMDGLAALERIMETCPTPVVMLSTLTGEGTDATIRALELGAVDFFLKPSLVKPAGTEELADDLRAKLKAAAMVKVRKLVRMVRPETLPCGTGKPAESTLAAADEVIIIGSSTGGPRALYQIIPALPAGISAAILIVQHMPPGFTRSLAGRLNELSQISVREACEGSRLRQGEALVAPGGYHMTVNKTRAIALNQEPPVCGVRPSVDVTMKTAVQAFGAAILGVVLTGMGFDGTSGTSAIKAAGGSVIAEDETTCSVYGMPRSVFEAGNADLIIPLPRIASEMLRILNNGMRNK